LLVQLLSWQQFFSWERCGSTWPRSAGVDDLPWLTCIDESLL
jgi:hypothetical protein